MGTPTSGCTPTWEGRTHQQTCVPPPNRPQCSLRPQAGPIPQRPAPPRGRQGLCLDEGPLSSPRTPPGQGPPPGHAGSGPRAGQGREGRGLGLLCWVGHPHPARGLWRGHGRRGAGRRWETGNQRGLGSERGRQSFLTI